MTAETPPRLFMSYSHDTELHKAWVLALANRLLANGVDVLLDRWDLRLGSNLGHFMETGLSAADRVLAICTTPYSQKANNGVGGVGYEKVILTAQIMANLHSDKVIPVLRENLLGTLPTFLSSRVYLDFREESAYEERYAELIREIHGQRVISRPPLGANPFSASTMPLLAFSKERYVSPSMTGTISFDYSNNNGSYTVGLGDLAFETKWSTGGSMAIHAYTDGANIQSLALATGVSSLADLQDVSIFDNSSRVRTPNIGEIIIWRNHAGYYLATKIESISVRVPRRVSSDQLTFTYAIQPNRTSLFSA